MATDWQANVAGLLALLDRPRRSGSIAGVGGLVNTGSDFQFSRRQTKEVLQDWRPAGLQVRTVPDTSETHHSAAV